MAYTGVALHALWTPGEACGGLLEADPWWL